MRNVFYNIQLFFIVDNTMALYYGNDRRTDAIRGVFTSKGHRRCAYRII